MNSIEVVQVTQETAPALYVDGAILASPLLKVGIEGRKYEHGVIAIRQPGAGGDQDGKLVVHLWPNADAQKDDEGDGKNVATFTIDLRQLIADKLAEAGDIVQVQDVLFAHADNLDYSALLEHMLEQLRGLGS